MPYSGMLKAYIINMTAAYDSSSDYYYVCLEEMDSYSHPLYPGLRF